LYLRRGMLWLTAGASVAGSVTSARTNSMRELRSWMEGMAARMACSAACVSLAQVSQAGFRFSFETRVRRYRSALQLENIAQKLARNLGNKVHANRWILYIIPLSQHCGRAFEPARTLHYISS
jgi:hypothetical protein